MPKTTVATNPPGKAPPTREMALVYERTTAEFADWTGHSIILRERDVPLYEGTDAEAIQRLDKLSDKFGLDAWSDEASSQDELYDFGGLPK